MILKFITKTCRNIYTLLDHEGNAKWVGVYVKGDDFHIYGNPVDMFGTEPWLITVGNHVHITREVLFITHYGDTLLFRHLSSDLEIYCTYCCR